MKHTPPMQCAARASVKGVFRLSYSTGCVQAELACGECLGELLYRLSSGGAK
uniref:Uncharacterized protein n=1 Tax=Anguilla anguilla TaxID=7936 RepID=A0A0E9TFD0_ANGAN